MSTSRTGSRAESDGPLERRTRARAGCPASGTRAAAFSDSSETRSTTAPGRRACWPTKNRASSGMSSARSASDGHAQLPGSSAARSRGGGRTPRTEGPEVLARTRTSGTPARSAGPGLARGLEQLGEPDLQLGRQLVDLLEEERAALGEVELARGSRPPARRPSRPAPAKRLEVWPGASSAQLTWMNGWRPRGDGGGPRARPPPAPPPCGPVRTRASAEAACCAIVSRSARTAGL